MFVSSSGKCVCVCVCVGVCVCARAPVKDCPPHYSSARLTTCQHMKQEGGSLSVCVCVCVCAHVNDHLSRLERIMRPEQPLQQISGDRRILDVNILARFSSLCRSTTLGLGSIIHLFFRSRPVLPSPPSRALTHREPSQVRPRPLRPGVVLLHCDSGSARL